MIDTKVWFEKKPGSYKIGFSSLLLTNSFHNMAGHGHVEQEVFTIPEKSMTTSHESATAGMPGRKPPGMASLQREGSD